MLEVFTSISLDRSAEIPLYMQLYRKLKELIENGILIQDMRLPSIRKFANSLGVNNATVVSALNRLEREGYIYTKPGSGNYVSALLPSAGSMSASREFITDELYQYDDVPVITNGQIKINAGTIDFASATPTSDLFPVEDFKIVLNEVLDRDKGSAFGYQDSQGFYPIRESMLGMMGKYGIESNTESIQIISGAQQGIDIISKAFLNQGDYVVTESPTYTGAVAVFKSRGAQIIDVEMEAGGPDLNLIEYNLKRFRPKLIYTIPSFQNPTGYSYSNAKRTELLKLAEKYNTYIIEDDYVSDLDFGHKGFIPLKAMDKSGKVIFVKSFSKIFMPGLRLGFMIASANLQGEILNAKHTTDISTSGLIQRAFDLYIRKGLWDRHFNIMYDIYKKRYFEMTEALDSCLPHGASYTKPCGGLNIWLKLPFGFPVDSMAKRAVSENIVFAPGRIFYSSGALQKLNNIRLSFASAYVENITPGIEKLCRLIGDFQGKHQEYENTPIL